MTDTGASDIIDRGVIWDDTDGFNPSDGTKVSDVTLPLNMTGLFDVPIV